MLWCAPNSAELIPCSLSQWQRACYSLRTSQVCFQLSLRHLGSEQRPCVSPKGSSRPINQSPVSCHGTVDTATGFGSAQLLARVGHNEAKTRGWIFMKAIHSSLLSLSFPHSIWAWAKTDIKLITQREPPYVTPCRALMWRGNLLVLVHCCCWKSAFQKGPRSSDWKNRTL